MHIILAMNESGDTVAFGPFTGEVAAQSALTQLRNVIDVFGPATYQVMQLATLPDTSPKPNVVPVPTPLIVQAPSYIHQLYPAWCTLCNMYHTHTPAVTWGSGSFTINVDA